MWAPHPRAAPDKSRGRPVCLHDRLPHDIGWRHRNPEHSAWSACSFVLIKVGDFGRHTIAETAKLFPDRPHLDSLPRQPLFTELSDFSRSFAAERTIRTQHFPVKFPDPGNSRPRRVRDRLHSPPLTPTEMTERSPFCRNAPNPGIFCGRLRILLRRERTSCLLSASSGGYSPIRRVRENRPLPDTGGETLIAGGCPAVVPPGKSSAACNPSSTA
jgi:hypothetical protein